MTQEELIAETIKYFGKKNRRRLKNTITSLEFEGEETKRWKKSIKKITEHPFIISDGMYDYVIENIINKNFDDIEMDDIGDLSWNIKILLNKNCDNGYDWDKKLATKCGGTAKILEIYINFIVPAYTLHKYYITYNKGENYYEFGEIKTDDYENKIIRKIKNLFKKLNYFYVTQNLASKNFPELVSDVNRKGNATIFDCLFSDVYFYQEGIKRFNDKSITDQTGKKIHWNEYYNNKGKLLYREEYRYFESKNVLCSTTNNKGEITKIDVWRDIGRHKHKKFSLDIEEAQKK